MTTCQLQTLTVPKLRDLCRKAALPVWQYRGHRLNKGDLVAALARHSRHSRRKAKPRKKPARRPKARQTAVQPRESGIADSLAEQLIQMALCDLPGDRAYSVSMDRVLRNRGNQRDRQRLIVKRIEAIKSLRDSAGDEATRLYWGNRYAQDTAVAGC